MPKRSNEFQRLIYHIQRQLTAPCVVSESRLLIDRITGEEREVDVTIDVRAGTYELLISLECNARTRKATVEWVEQMIEKHRTLPTNQLFLVSEAGFSERALQKAASCGAQTFSLSKAIDADWTVIVGKLSRLFFARYDFKTTGFSIQIDGEPDQWYAIRLGQEFTRADGSLLATAIQIASKILNEHTIASKLMSAMDEDGKKLGTYEFDAPEPWFSTDASNRRHKVLRLKLYFEMTRDTTPIDLTHAAWEDIPVAYGTGSTSFGLTQLTVVEPARQPMGGFVSMPDPKTGVIKAFPFLAPVPDSEGPPIVKLPADDPNFMQP